MKQRPESTVLFLCTGNYYRSRYAEILFNSVLRHVWELIFMYRVAPPIFRRIPLPRRVPAKDLEKVYQ